MVPIKLSIIALTLVGAVIPPVVALPTTSHVAPGPNIFSRGLDSSSQQLPHTQESHTQESHTPEIYPRADTGSRSGSPNEHHYYNNNDSPPPSPQSQVNQPLIPHPAPPPAPPRRRDRVAAVFMR